MPGQSRTQEESLDDPELKEITLEEAMMRIEEIMAYVGELDQMKKKVVSGRLWFFRF